MKHYVRYTALPKGAVLCTGPGCSVCALGAERKRCSSDALSLRQPTEPDQTSRDQTVSKSSSKPST